MSARERQQIRAGGQLRFQNPGRVAESVFRIGNQNQGIAQAAQTGKGETTPKSFVC